MATKKVRTCWNSSYLWTDLGYFSYSETVFDSRKVRILFLSLSRFLVKTKKNILDSYEDFLWQILSFLRYLKYIFLVPHMYLFFFWLDPLFIVFHFQHMNKEVVQSVDRGPGLCYCIFKWAPVLNLLLCIVF